jgi:hypothetical protein
MDKTFSRFDGFFYRLGFFEGMLTERPDDLAVTLFEKQAVVDT